MSTASRARISDRAVALRVVEHVLGGGQRGEHDDPEEVLVVEREHEPSEQPRDRRHERELDDRGEQHVTSVRARLQRALPVQRHAERQQHDRHGRRADQPERLEQRLGQLDAADRHDHAQARSR